MANDPEPRRSPYAMPYDELVGGGQVHQEQLVVEQPHEPPAPPSPPSGDGDGD